MVENLRASLGGEVAKLQESMSKQVESQLAKVELSPGKLTVRPLTSHSSRRRV